MVERPRQRPGPCGADPPIGRLQPDDTAERRRDADRAAGVAAERERYLASSEHDGRAAARASRDPIERPRVVRRAERFVDGGDPPCELVRLRLADEDRPGSACPADRLGVARRDVRAEHRRAVRRSHPLGVEQVLDRERDPLERPSLAPSPRRLGRERLLARSLQAERREPAHQAVDRVDAGGARVHDLDRRQPPRSELLQEPLDAVICKCVHRSGLDMRPTRRGRRSAERRSPRSRPRRRRRAQA